MLRGWSETVLYTQIAYSDWHDPILAWISDTQRQQYGDTYTGLRLCTASQESGVQPSLHISTETVSSRLSFSAQATLQQQPE